MDTRIVSIGVYQKRSSAKNTLVGIVSNRVIHLNAFLCSKFQNDIFCHFFKKEAVLKFEDLWYTFRRVFWDPIFFSGGFEVHMGYNDLALR